MTTLDLINAINEKKISLIQSSFNELMTEKVANALTNMRMNILSGINEEYDIIDLEEITESELDEGAGNLSGLPNHIIKAAVSRASAGKDSEVESSGRIKNASALKKHIHDAMEKGHAAVVHVDGKPVKAVVSKGAWGGSRPSYEVHNDKDIETQREAITPRPRRIGGKMHYSPTHYYDNPSHNKGEALNKMIHAATGGEDKDVFKNKHIEVKTIKPDLERRKKAGERQSNRPNMRTVYDDPKNYKGKTSTTHVGDDLKGIKDAAAMKLAGKKLAGKSSASAEAEKLHTELGKHLASGNAREAQRAIENLRVHIQTHGLKNTEDKKKEYAKSLQDLKSHYDKDYAKRNLAALRNESEEINIDEEFNLLLDEISNS